MGRPMRTVDQGSLVEVEEVEALEVHQIHSAALGVMISSRHWHTAEPTKLRSHGLFLDALNRQKSSVSLIALVDRPLPFRSG